MEVAPGIHRIESVLGPRPFAQYLLRDERSLLVDSGVVSTPDEVILPYLRRMGMDPADLAYVLISHADVDHFGGTARIVAAAPRAVVLAHALDAPWVASGERILRERYGWYEAHGPAVDYDAGTKAWLREALGPDVPVDLALRGGETIRLGPNLTVEVLHLPGHTPGHVGLWEPVSGTAIVTDAVLGAGLLDTEGRVIHPPPYFDVAAYAATVAAVRALRPNRLLTAHFAVMDGAEVEAFLDASDDFILRARAAVAEILAGSGEVDLAGLVAAADARLGPFTSMANELAGTVRAHADELVAAGAARSEPGSGRWRAVKSVSETPSSEGGETG